MFRRWFVPVAFALLTAVPLARADAQSLPAANGRVIEAADGDVVVLPAGARVAVVRRSQVQARLVYVAAQQTLLLLTDPATGSLEGMPEAKGFRRFQLHGPWPLEPRWEGSATIDEYVPSGHVPFGLAIHTDRGTILVGPLHGREAASTPPPVAVVRTTSSSSRLASGSFDDIEQAWLAGGDNALQGPGGRMQMHASGGSAVVGNSIGSAPAGAVRVGGNIRPPTRTQFVEPAYPQTARTAGVQGVVILELVIGEDGAVSNARVLRSIPLLDQAALDAVRQWRYEPTLLNGVPTRAIMTATVNFSLPPSVP
jgi:TonB family protein